MLTGLFKTNNRSCASVNISEKGAATFQSVCFGTLKRLLLAATLSLTSWSGMAVTMGVLHWKVTPGQPPVAEIAINDKNPVDPGSLRVSIVTPAAYSAMGLTYNPGLANALITAHASPSGLRDHAVLRLEGLQTGVAPFDLLVVISIGNALIMTEYRIDRPEISHDVQPSRFGTRLAMLASKAKSEQESITDVKESSKTEDSARAALLAWAHAWSKRDVTSYFAAYTADYVGNPAQASHQTWADLRRKRIESRTRISVELENIELTRKGDTITANFTQNFSSDGPSDRLQKRMVLIWQDRRWLIQSEVVLK